MKITGFKAGLLALCLVTALFAPCRSFAQGEEALAETAAATEEAPKDEGAMNASRSYQELKEVLASKENYEYLKSMLIMMNENRPLEETNAVIFEVKQYVQIAEDLLKVVKIFYEKGAELESMQRMVAKSHMLMSVFYSANKNYKDAIDEFKLAEETFPAMYEDTTLEVEFNAYRPQKKIRNLVAYEMRDPASLKSDLEGQWGHTLTFEVEVVDLEPQTLSAVNIKSLNPLATESAAFRLLEIANKTVGEKLANGERFFRLTLSTGSYQLVQEEGLVFPQVFEIFESSGPLTLLVQPDNWFTLQYEKNYKNPPALLYHGIEITDFSKLAYGEYELDADPTDFNNPPEKLVFMPEGEPVATAEFTQIVVPPQSKHILNLDQLGVMDKLRKR